MARRFEDLDIVFGFIHKKVKVIKDGEEGWLVWDSVLYHEISFVGMESEQQESLYTCFSESEAEEEFEELLSEYKEVPKQTAIKMRKRGGNNTSKSQGVEELLAEINNLVGLKELKKDLEKLINLVRVQKMREEHGLPQTPISLHIVFTGNPGTGKTTVARMLSKIYYELGILSKGHLVETDRSGLVGGYIGQTAIKVTEMVNKAMGGILFIDEAYSLAQGGEKDFGREAIDTLIKLMEDHREDLIIIVAGYPEEMKRFIDINPGMRSRFNTYMNFDDYNEYELQRIFELMCNNKEFTLSSEAKEKSLSVFKSMVANKQKDFSNGRDVRNIFENTISNQASRIIKIKSPSKKVLSTILPEDIESYRMSFS